MQYALKKPHHVCVCDVAKLNRYKKEHIHKTHTLIRLPLTPSPSFFLCPPPSSYAKPAAKYACGEF